jgi:WD40 repeat protein
MGLEAEESPDGTWLASACLDEKNAHVRIARLDGIKAWDLYFEEITTWPPCILYKNQYGEDACIGGILYIDHWYKAGRYVFVSADYQIDRATNFRFGLYRIDAETGQASAYLPLNGTAYNYAFSPDDEKYAYVTASDNYFLHVISMETGHDSTLTVPGRYSNVGELIWSPDSSRLVMVSRGIGWEEKLEVGFSLVMLDAQSGKFTELILNDTRRFLPAHWLSDDVLLLSGFSADGQEYLEYQFMISTNELMPTPKGTPSS